MSVRISKAVYGGDSLGRTEDGRVVLLPFVLPGEVVDDGQVRQPAAERVQPRCVHFGRCGGCQYQEAAYPLQVRMKVGILRETLERAGLRKLPEIAVLTAEPWGYRNRIRMRIEEVEGAVRFGYNVRQTNEFLPIKECPIAAPVLWRTAMAMASLQWMQGVREVELLCTADEAEVQVLLQLRGRASSGFDRFCAELKAVAPEVAGVGAEGLAWGRKGLRYVVDGRGYWVSRAGFFQVNRWLLPEFVRMVAAGRRGLLAWDLYAGVGLFSRVLADGFAQVVAVEANAQAVRDLESAKIANIRGLASSVGNFLRQAAVGRDRPDLVVLDPPRAGLGKAEAGLLASLQIPQIVYVACDPTTLARDLKVMVDSGYDLAELHLVDLFPQTYHLETVAVLQR